MSEIIHRFNVLKNDNIHNRIDYECDETYLSSDDEDLENINIENNEKNSEENNYDNEENVYIVKVNEQVKCYCSNVDELDEIVEYLIEKLKFKYLSNGWCNIRHNSKNNKSTWKIVDKNRIVTQIFGNKPNLLINYDTILCEIEVEIVKKYTEKKLLNI